MRTTTRTPRRHVAEFDLALYASGDLNLWQRLKTEMHTRGCERCQARIAVYRSDQEQVRKVSAALPEGMAWQQMAAEMTANIRVGLAAGECVAPRESKVTFRGWRPAAAIAGLSVLLVTGWWLNMPSAQTQSLGRAMQAIWHGRGSAVVEDAGATVEANSSGIELRQNGSSLGVSQGGSAPIAVSVSVQGSARARYVDADTGQVTITSVYAQ